MNELTMICPGAPSSGRFVNALQAALRGHKVQRITLPGDSLENRRILFAVSLPEDGVNPGLSALLSHFRTHPNCLAGSVGGVIVDCPADLYTKSVGRELVLAASMAGCTFPGRSLVEAPGSLQNFTVQAQNAGCDLLHAYHLAAADLSRRILEFEPPKSKRPKLTVLHASNHETSNTLELWSHCRAHLEDACEITEIGLRNGTLEDCAGCAYTDCLHYGEADSCFYGGVMVQEVYPAVREADALILLCPNYNDALSANLTAAINRLTALYRTAPFFGKAVFAIVVSGYSGGDIVASQVVSALNMNKGFWLPGGFCLLETAHNPGTAIALPGIESRLKAFSERILLSLRA